MTDKRSFADEVRDRATDDDPPRAHRAPYRRWTDVMECLRPALVVHPIPIPGQNPAPGSCARRST